MKFSIGVLAGSARSQASKPSCSIVPARPNTFRFHECAAVICTLCNDMRAHARGARKMHGGFENCTEVSKTDTEDSKLYGRLEKKRVELKKLQFFKGIFAKLYVTK